MIALFAPFNDVLGAFVTQSNATGIPDTTTSPTFTYVTDPYVTSALTPVPSGAANLPSVRWTNFCVSVYDLDAIATVSQSMQAVKWVQAAIPLAASPLTGGPASSYGGMYNSISEMDTNSGVRTREVPIAALLEGVCFRSAMIDRSGLEFTPVATGSAAWTAAYGGQSSGTNASIGSFLPWAPLVFNVNLPPPTTPVGVSISGTGLVQTINLRFVVEGEIEISPPANNFMYRMGRTQGLGGPAAEHSWFAAQRVLLEQGFVGGDAPSMGRTGRYALGR